MSKRKYKARYCIESMVGFAEYDGTYFIIRYGKTLKTQHREFVESMRYNTLKRFVENGLVYAAEKITEVRDEV